MLLIGGRSWPTPLEGHGGARRNGKIRQRSEKRCVMSSGNPRCSDCAGRGYIRVRGRFVACTCVKGTREQLRVQHERRMDDPTFRAFMNKLRKK
jgi:hypothetical protein